MLTLLLRVCGPTVYKNLPGTDDAGGTEDDVHYTNIRDGDTFSVPGATLRAVATPGHTQVGAEPACRRHNAHWPCSHHAMTSL